MNNLSDPGEDFLSSLVACKNLNSIHISFNPITGVLPKSLGSSNLSTSLETFKAFSCRLFHGSIFPVLCNLKHLYSLNVAMNSLSGQLPSCFGNLSSLREICMSDNEFNGNIASILWLLKGVNLVALDLSRNQLSGEIPSTISQLENLVRLSLSILVIGLVWKFSARKPSPLSDEVGQDKFRGISYQAIVCATDNFDDRNMIDVQDALKSFHRVQSIEQSDFGISKFLSEEERMLRSRTLGTVGYVAPATGFLLMEMLSRRKPTDEMLSGELSLRRWISESFPDSVLQILDNEMLDKGDEEARVVFRPFLTSAIELALECTADMPEERPTKMAYAAVLSLAQTAGKMILDQDRYPISRNKKQQIRSIYEPFIFLQEFLEDFPEKAYILDGRIRDLAYEAEGILECFMLGEAKSHWWTVLASKSKFKHQMGKIRAQADSITREVMAMKNNSSDAAQHGDSSVAGSPSRLAPVTKIEYMVGLHEETDVAAYADRLSPLHEMRLMDEGQSWNLLRQMVFAHQDCPPELENIGKEVARCCKGLPLTIVVVAGILSTMENNLASWRKIAQDVNSVTVGGQSSTLERFRLLRVLDARDVYVSSLPGELFDLFHLVYLAIYYLGGLPSAISKLRSLQTLHLRAKNEWKLFRFHCVCLPPAIWMMPQLRHLVFYGRLPDPEGRTTPGLDNLQTLSIVSHAMCSERVLRMIRNLKKLEIDCSDCEVCLNNLVHLHQLEDLKLRSSSSNAFYQKDMFTFPRMLKRLTLSRVPLPWDEMTIVGSLSNLRVLKLTHQACKGKKWETTEGEFPLLEFLLIEKSDICLWITESSHFPMLKRLVLDDCWQLAEIPEDIGEIPTLELIEVKGKAVMSLVESVKRILEEQQGWGNDALQIRCMTHR
ncbi:hypothetical protein SASPL_127462 [Salvia splendens]|uniref:Disease resistance R13L4/SHOC-2-like LRR domain-containing protein n=1 Tax=Salvia splendens TaxID=180675 RepID=A0A8X8ZLX8_SALSN|nr:hypothetical protein SASPL_127462 [Salvia splendens]